MNDQQGGSGPSSELEMLKNRARLLGVDFSNNIGIDTLRERVAAKMGEINEDAPAPKAPVPVAQGNALAPEEPVNPLGSSFEDGIEDEEEETPPVRAVDVPDLNLKPYVMETQREIPNPSKSDPSNLASTITAAPAGKPLSLRQHIYNRDMVLIRVRIQNLDPKKKDLQGEVLSISNRYLGTVKKFVPYGENTDDGWHLPKVILDELLSRKFLNITTTRDKITRQIKVSKRWAKEFSIEILPPLTKEELNRLAIAQAAAGSIDAVSDELS